MLTMVEATQALSTLTIQLFFFRIVDHGRCSEPWFSVGKIEVFRANLISKNWVEKLGSGEAMEGY